ncbi:DUF5983 family protein, partial [Escherichia coli]
DNRSRHDRLAVRLSLIISRLMAGESLSLKTLSDEFGVGGYLLRTDAWSYPVLRLKRLGLSRTFRRLVVTLIRRYGVSLIHLDAGAECLQDLPTFNW